MTLTKTAAQWFNLKEFIKAQCGYDIDTEVDLSEDEPFIRFLSLKLMFYADAIGKLKQQDFNLQRKTNYLMNGLESFLHDYQANNDNHFGSFFRVRYGGISEESEPQYYTIFNRGHMDGESLKKSKLVNDFLEGRYQDDTSQKSNITITEFFKSKDNGEQWKDLYNPERAPQVDGVETGEPLDILNSDTNRLVMFRIGKIDLMNRNSNFADTINQKGLGVMGFYREVKSVDNEQLQQFTNPTAIRYVLALRNDIASFIRQHHQNEEFRDWIEADRQRNISLLIGHGREMLIDFTNEYPDYQSILNTMIVMMHLIVELESSRDLNNSKLKVKLISAYKEFNIKQFLPTGSINAEKFLSEAKTMAKTVYESDIIETKVICNVLTTGNSSQLIEFPENLLKMFLFEIIVNAKKNRFVFLNKNDALPNVIKIGIKYETENKFKLFVKNTCPRPRNIQHIRRGKAKIQNTISGLGQIDKILEKFELGSWSVSYDELASDKDILANYDEECIKEHNIYIFTTELSLEYDEAENTSR